MANPFKCAVDNVYHVLNKVSKDMENFSKTISKQQKQTMPKLTKPTMHIKRIGERSLRINLHNMLILRCDITKEISNDEIPQAIRTITNSVIEVIQAGENIAWKLMSIPTKGDKVTLRMWLPCTVFSNGKKVHGNIHITDCEAFSHVEACGYDDCSTVEVDSAEHALFLIETANFNVSFLSMMPSWKIVVED